MKTFLKCVFFMMLLFSQLHTKAQAFNKVKYGIYLSANDYKHNKLSYGFDSANHNNRIVLYNTFGSSKIQVISNGGKKSFARNEIYGYRNNGVNYRVFNGEDFLIVDTADFFIYSQIHQVREMKWQSQKQTVYFFSVNANSNVEPLTRINVENAFQYNEQFDHYLVSTFKKDDELVAYDKRLKNTDSNTCTKNTRKDRLKTCKTKDFVFITSKRFLLK